MALSIADPPSSASQYQRLNTYHFRADKHPEWYLNLRDNPEVQVQVKADRFRARARTATPEGHKALWPRMVEIWPDCAKYQQKTDRQIPLVILERT